MCLALLGKGDVLYWQLTDEARVDGDLIQDYLVPYPSTEDSWPAARIKLVTVDGYSKILPIDFGDGVSEDGYLGAELFDWDSGWGTGRPTGWQSETGYNTILRIQDEITGDTTTIDYPPEVMEALFIMELGYNEPNSVGDYVWKTLAESTPEIYKELVNEHMYRPGDVNTPSATPWTPMVFHTVPEPTTFLLLLLGFGILALRRKNGNS